MSRIGLKPITIPEGVEVNISGSSVLVKGPKGELTQELPHHIKASAKDGVLSVERVNNTKVAKSMHGMSRALLANMITGVTEGYKKTLEMVGTGYRVNKQGKKLVISVGLSHNVDYDEPEGITLNVEENNIIHVEGRDKQQVGHVAAEIRSIKPPEPYKGKGIKYQGEYVRRKAGKAAKAESEGA